MKKMEGTFYNQFGKQKRARVFNPLARVFCYSLASFYTNAK